MVLPVEMILILQGLLPPKAVTLHCCKLSKLVKSLRVPLCKHTLLSCSEHKDSSEKKHKDKEKTKHKDGSSEKHKDKHKDKDKEKRKEEKVGVSCRRDNSMVLVYVTEWHKLGGLDVAFI